MRIYRYMITTCNCVKLIVTTCGNDLVDSTIYEINFAVLFFSCLFFVYVFRLPKGRLIISRTRAMTSKIWISPPAILNENPSIHKISNITKIAQSIFPPPIHF